MRRRVCCILCSLMMAVLLSGCGFFVARSYPGLIEKRPLYYKGVLLDCTWLYFVSQEADEGLVKVALMIPTAVDMVPTAVLETAWAPVVAVDRFLYSRYPPLVVLIKEGRYDELETRLKSGTNPDQLHRWHPEKTPIDYSLHRGDLRAFDLLVKHGAQVTKWKVTSPSISPLEIAFYAFENDLHEQIPPPNNGYVHAWCVKELGRSIPERDNADKLEIILVKLLKAGYSFEPWLNRPGTPTALDLVLLAPNLSQDVKDRLEKAFREAGAETYPEKVAKDPSLPHLDLSGKNIDPMFARFLHVLQCAECREGILVITALPGLPSDVPVLVVDFKSAEKERGPRKWTLGEATKSVQWTVGTETKTGEIPVGARLIVVPDHVEIPSQVGDVPEEILQEVRFKVPGFNILLLKHDMWVHPDIDYTISRFALLTRKRFDEFVLARPKTNK